MSRVKEIFMYLLALIVLLAPVIILGWMGLTLFGWLGLILGIITGLIIFAVSVNKIATQEVVEEDQEALPPAEAAPELPVPPSEKTLEETGQTIAPEGR